MSNFITIDTFATKHNVSIHNVYVLKQDRLPSCIFKMKNGLLFIDDTYLIRRKDFKNRVWLQSHDMYYFLSGRMRDIRIAEMLHKLDPSIGIKTWVIFLSRTLFMCDDRSVLSTKIAHLMWQFYRFARWLVRDIFIKDGVRKEDRNLELYLDAC